MRSASRFSLMVTVILCCTTVTHGQTLDVDQPDPAAVQRYGPAYRYPQAGWTVLHIEGEAYERGYQHGRLMAPEIGGYLRCFAAVLGPKAPAEAWQSTRKLANALFVRRFVPEFLEEMKGIAEGATATGEKIFGRPIDLTDIVALNCWPEIETLDSALAAVPTGLEGKTFAGAQPHIKPEPRPEHCSAFAATGPATKDGKIVFGHITMFALYPSNFYNVWLDIKPAKGHRMLMCAYPGAMQSGMDYYLNDAGLLIAETTIGQTRFNANGMTEASRIRQAIQYANGIDDVVAILQKDNNGLYTNEWLLGDINTNEIALFELGTDKSKLHRSSKNEWIGGTTGFYWGCNNTKDISLRLETIPSVNGRPANLVFEPSARDQAWQRLYQKHKGKIDVNFAKEAFTTPPIAAYHSLDAKFTTTDMAKQLKSWALFGPPLGRTWEPTFEERKLYPEVKPLVSNPWTILHANPPPQQASFAAIDIPNSGAKALASTTERSKSKADLMYVPAWHGTLLPQTDGDVWLAAGFADYERIVAAGKKHPTSDADQSPGDREALALNLFKYRSRYLTALGGIKEEVPLVSVKSSLAKDDWYRAASGKGVLVFQELRRLLGDGRFASVMDAFGRANAGQRITTAQFLGHLEKAAGKDAARFVESWVKATRLPKVELHDYSISASGAVRGVIQRDAQPPISKVDVTVGSPSAEITRTIELKGTETPFEIDFKGGQPTYVLLDKYRQTAMAGMPAASIHSFAREQERTLIVYGTMAETPTNREAAELLQKAIRESGLNFTVPVKADGETTEQDLRDHHVILIGRPDSNALVRRFERDLPIAFGSRSFLLRGHNYAHPDSAVIVAAENPLNKRTSLVVAAGLAPASMRRVAPKLAEQMGQPADALLLQHGEGSRVFALPKEAPR